MHVRVRVRARARARARVGVGVGVRLSCVARTAQMALSSIIKKYENNKHQ